MNNFTVTHNNAQDLEIRVKCRPVDLADRQAFGEELVQSLYNHYGYGSSHHIVSKDPTGKGQPHEYKFYIRIGQITETTQTPNGLKFKYGVILDYYIDKVEQVGGLYGVTLKQF